MSGLPPNLKNYLSNAFNAKQANFLSEPVFKLTFKKHQKVNWDGQEKDIPDQVSAAAVSKSVTQKSSILMGNKSEYDRLFSASVAAEYSGVTYSGSGSSSYLYHGNLFTDTSSSYALDIYAQSLLKFERLKITPDDLEEGFKNAVKGLPSTVATPADRQLYFDFFDTYGTHYSELAGIGGMVVMETKVKNSLTKSTSEHEVTAAITAGYNGVVAKGKMSADVAYESSTFLQDNREEISIKISVEGGLFSQDGSISEWKKSLYETPIFLLDTPLSNGSVSELISIAKLAEILKADDHVVDNIKRMTRSYVVADDFDDGILGTPKNIDFSTVSYDKLGDGFLIGQVRETQNGVRGSVELNADPGENPSTVRAYASQHYYTDSDRYIPYASCTIPTPANDSTTGISAPTFGAPYFSLNHVGMGNVDNKSFGAFESIDSGKAITKTADGFVVACIDASNGGNRGYVVGKFISDGKEEIKAGSSAHLYSGSDIYVPKNSFCMPVPANQKFQIDCTKTSGNPNFKLFFVPFLSTEIVLGTYEERDVNLKFEASEDGFLLVLLNAIASNGSRSNATLFCDLSEQDLKAEPLASTSVHYYTGSDAHVPCNSAMVPIAKDSHYLVEYNATYGSPAVSAWWIPLTRGIV